MGERYATFRALARSLGPDARRRAVFRTHYNEQLAGSPVRRAMEPATTMLKIADVRPSSIAGAGALMVWLAGDGAARVLANDEDEAVLA